MVGNFFKGIGTYGKAINLLNRYRLWRWVLLPGLISLVLGGAVITFAAFYVDDLSIWLGEKWPFEFGEQVFEVVVGILSVIVMVVLVLLSLKYIILVLVSPFMGTLSEQVEAKVTGKPAPEASFGQIFADIGRGLAIAARNIVRELFYTIVLTVVGLFFPVVGQVLSSVLIFMVQSYYLGFGNMDFALERRRYSVADTVDFVNSYRWMVMGNGAAFILLLLIPGVGLLLAPGLGTVAATLNAMEALDGVTYQSRDMVED
jgi:CysZ protein